MGTDKNSGSGGKGSICLSRACKTTGRMCQNGGISLNLQQKISGEEPESNDQQSLREDSLANPILVLENAKRLVIAVTSGRNCGESFAKLNPDGSWAKMSRGCVQVRMDGSMEEYCETWPRWGILSGGVAGKLPISEHHTIGNGSSLLPTVMAHNLECAGKEYNPGSRHSLKLSQSLDMIPTLTAQDAHGHGYQKQKNGTKTLTIAGLLPTCTSRDYKDCGNMENVPTNALLGRELGKNHGLKLQPAFAEWMMGFPIGWTALGALGMQSFRSKSTRSSKRSRITKGVNNDNV
jgi:hypothetical protein